MSANVISDNNQQPVNECSGDDDDSDALFVPTSLGLGAGGGNAQERVSSISLRKRQAERGQEEEEEEESSHPKFSVTSYNSAFLQGLFGDIAANNPKEDLNDAKADTLRATTFNSESMASIKSEHNLAKRRLVSATKSLQRCGPSLANLMSAGSVVVSPFKCRHSSMILTKPKDLPATVSASLSFQLDRSKSTDDLPRKVVTSSQDTPEGDFGWFVDPDVHGDSNARPRTQTQKSIPLAFSAPTAPIPNERNDQAEVEWAQAADTVDEVLGDFF
ncbi:expressed unknown protein [Seminavis robusta]|uniref:Uncharacterized protein n=1 Tax=Seminavis robusta TaxID=568900 RepID=A0A9N8H4L9_9STRA|nr:expressed unknown protein [Seminavis robusta]|eukprot:Sro87_g046260.1 n/a (274) ;mRNA; f:113504-114325